MSDQRPNLQQIFEIARRISDSDLRLEYLNQVCSDRSDLEQVLDLLNADQDSGSFLVRPAVPVAVDETHDGSSGIGVGTEVGPYKLLQELGEGGMGIVYLAQQQRPIQRQVALKLIKPGLDSRHVIARFEAERQALALMNHPNIARVFDAGATVLGQPFFVMELVKGVPITQYCDDRRLDARQRLALLREVCDAVQHAHQKGIIHRDLKPSNVLVAEYDDRAVPKIIDFGVAKATQQSLTEKTMFTEIGSVIGTVEYMSPEQAQVNQLDVDTRSDVYSLGVLLYELLAGETPFSRERLRSVALDEMLRIIREEEPSRPSIKIASSISLPSVAANRSVEPVRLRMLVSGELDWIVMKSLEKERKRRYQTATAMADDIGRYLDDAPVSACPPSILYRLRKTTRRNKAAIATTLAVAATLIVGIIGTSWQALRAERERRLAVESSQAAETARENETSQRQLAETQRDRAVKAEQRAEVAAAQERTQRLAAESARKYAIEQELLARKNLYSADMNLAYQAFERNEMPRALELLYRHVPGSGEPDWRSFEWYYLLEKFRREDLVVPTFRGHPTFSPDGRQLALGYASDLQIWNIDDHSLVRTIKDAATGDPTTYSPDGQFIATVKNHAIHLWNADDGRLVKQFGQLSQRARDLRFTRDGNRIICTTGGDLDSKEVPGRIHVFDTESGAEVFLLDRHKRYIYSIDISADGKTLISHGGGSDGDPGTFVWDLETGQVKDIPVVNAGRPVALSPRDGLVATGDDQEIVLWNLSDGKIQARLATGPSVRPDWIDFSADGSLLAAGCENSEVMVFNVDTRKKVETFRGHTQVIFYLRFSPDGTRLVSRSRDGTARVWPIQSPRADRLLQTGNGDTRVRSFEEVGKDFSSVSHDGKLIAGVAAQTVRVIDPSTGDLLRTLSIGNRIRSLAFSRSDSRLAVAYDNGIQVWDASTGEIQIERKLDSAVVSVDFNPSGDRLAIHVGNERAELCDAKSLQTVRAIDLRPLGATQQIRKLLFAPSGNQLGVMTVDEASNRLSLWNCDDATLQWVKSFSYWAQDFGFSINGNELAVGFGNRWETYDGGRVAILETKTGKELKRLPVVGAICMAVAYCPDGKTLATVSENGAVTAWDLETSRSRITLASEIPHVLPSIQYAPVTSMHFMPDGRTLLTNRSRGPVRIWNSASNEKAKHFETYALHQRLQEYHEKQQWTRIVDITTSDASDDPDEERHDSVWLEQRANAFAELGRFGEAVVILERWVQAKPEDVQRWHLLAMAQLASGHQKSYRKVCGKMFERFAETADPTIALQVAWTCCLSDESVIDYGSAEKLVSLAAKESSDNDPNQGFALTALGLAQFRNGNFGVAVASLARAEEAFAKNTPPDSPFSFPWYLYDLILASRGMHDRATEWRDKSTRWYEQAVADNALSWNRNATVKLFQREAEQFRERHVKIDPQDPQHWLLMAEIARQQGDVESRSDALNRAVDVANGKPAPYLLRARFHEDQKQFLEAANDYLSCLNAEITESQTPNIKQEILHVVEALKNSRSQYPLLIKLLQATIPIAPKATKLHYQLAFIQHRAGQLPEALASSEAAIEHGGAQIHLLTMKASVLRDLGDFEQAIELCNQVLLKNPNYTWALFVRAGSRARQGDLSGALTDAILLARLESDRPGRRADLLRLATLILLEENSTSVAPSFEELDSLIKFKSVGDHPVQWEEFACYLIASGRLTEYQEFCRQMFERHRNSTDAYIVRRLAAITTVGKESGLSKQDFLLLFEKLPPHLTRHRAQLMFRCGQTNESASYWDTEETVTSGDPKRMVWLGLVAAQRGERELALRMQAIVSKAMQSYETEFLDRSAILLWQRELQHALVNQRGRGY